MSYDQVRHLAEVSKPTGVTNKPNVRLSGSELEVASRKRQRPTSGKHTLETGSDHKATKIEYKKGLWAKEEDFRLLEFVRQQQEGNKSHKGPKPKKLNWTIVSKGMKTRSCKQCRERWVNHLNPGVRKTKWTAEEDEQLLALAQKNPRKWALIARQMPGRTENMVKIRWNSLNKQSGTNRSPKNSIKKENEEQQAKQRPRVPQQQPQLHLDMNLSRGSSNTASHVDSPIDSSIPYIKNTLADYCGQFPEYAKTDAFIEDEFLDDFILDSFMFDSTPYNSTRSTSTIAYDSPVPINL